MIDFRSVRTFALLAASAAMVLSGCAAAPSSTDASSTPSQSASESAGTDPSTTVIPTASPENSETPMPDQPSESSEETDGFDAYAFNGKTLNGSAFEVAALRGKPTVFWFWTPWCTVCRADAPGIASLQGELGEDINFVGVAAQGTASEMVAFASETGVTGFPHLADLDSSIWSHFGVPYQPSYVFVDASGNSTLSVGSRSISELEAELRELIG